ncbi:MAG: succinate dehydrogenase, hydrophobic membrane anchor protein [Steroidobacteraceae bacterium]|nr:succinate dehydrogenase, hydrophobic membrane anchor protein [Steroidobacteraceae bacterium]
MSLRTPLGKVLGRGSAGEGVGHWWVQRVTAVALLPLTAWFGISLLSHTLQSYEAIRGWISQPWVAVLTLVLVLTLAWHSKLGVEVVIEDYVQGKGTKTALLLISTFVHVLAAAAGSFAILLLALT